MSDSAWLNNCKHLNAFEFEERSSRAIRYHCTREFMFLELFSLTKRHLSTLPHQGGRMWIFTRLGCGSQTVPPDSVHQVPFFSSPIFFWNCNPGCSRKVQKFSLLISLSLSHLPPIPSNNPRTKLGAKSNS